MGKTAYLSKSVQAALGRVDLDLPAIDLELVSRNQRMRLCRDTSVPVHTVPPAGVEDERNG